MAGPRWLAGLQDEEQEATRGRVGEALGEQFAGAWGGGRLADDGYPEAGCGEGVGHRVQRPRPEAHLGGAGAVRPLFGPVVGREIVGLAPGLALLKVDCVRMVD